MKWLHADLSCASSLHAAGAPRLRCLRRPRTQLNLLFMTPRPSQLAPFPSPELLNPCHASDFTNRCHQLSLHLTFTFLRSLSTSPSCNSSRGIARAFLPALDPFFFFFSALFLHTFLSETWAVADALSAAGEPLVAPARLSPLKHSFNLPQARSSHLAFCGG